MSERYSDTARFRTDLDAHITRGPHVDRDEDLSEMSAEIDASEASDAAMRASCVGCGLPRGAHSDAALAGCEAAS